MSSQKMKTVYPTYQTLQYSNLALSLIGEVIKRTSKTEFGDFIKTKIFDPLKMTSSGFNISEDLYNSDNVAVGHSARGRGLKREALPYFNTKGMAAAAGLWTNVEDLSKFISWQFRLLDQKDWNKKEILSKKTLTEMQRIQWVDKNLEKMWGLGFAVDKQHDNIVVGHGGHCPGYMTHAEAIPKKKIGIIVLTNASSRSTGDLKSFIMQTILAVGGDLKNVAPKPKVKKGWEKYLGHYTWYPIGKESLVFPWKGQLATLGFPTSKLKKSLRSLKHEKDHVFRMINKDDSEGLRMSFEVDKGGKTTHFIHGGYRIKKIQ
ncbi:MAG: beta-lactamase family protein [Bdellovibrionales bacterium]|nr:beta-lactamase family protein [Bdellovibrionales bacterium]